MIGDQDMRFRMLGFYHLCVQFPISLLFLCAGIIIHLINSNQDVWYCG